MKFITCQKSNLFLEVLLLTQQDLLIICYNNQESLKKLLILDLSEKMRKEKFLKMILLQVELKVIFTKMKRLLLELAQS
jgi:hypothetical protein